MMPMPKLLDQLGLSRRQLARAADLSSGRVSMFVDGAWWPQRNSANWLAGVRNALRQAGANDDTVDQALSSQLTAYLSGTAKNKTPSSTSAEGLSETTSGQAAAVSIHVPKATLELTIEEVLIAMLLQKQTIHQSARQHFGLARDPFTDDLTSASDVFLSKSLRFVREVMWSTVKHGGILAVTGESGAGKSTLRKDLIDRINREQANVIVIEPYVLAMEENDVKGKTLKSAAIAESLITTINPTEKPKRSAEARFAQLHRVLKDSAKSGNKHTLVIEEAHCLPTATLKHLKRFYELEDGFTKLLSIVLIGQPELRQKLSDKNAEVREVVQRCEVVDLPPLDNDLHDYLLFKFKRVGADVDKVLGTGAIDALRAKLTFSSGKALGQGGQKAVSLLYPLAVANVISAAINKAAELGAPVVDASIVQGV